MRVIPLLPRRLHLMKPAGKTSAMLRRELRVAFSRKTQPAWFRVLKWLLLVAGAVALHGTPAFWWFVVGLPVFGILLHLFYRRQTRRWTRPWGGWKDLETAGDPAASSSSQRMKDPG